MQSYTVKLMWYVNVTVYVKANYTYIWCNPCIYFKPMYIDFDFEYYIKKLDSSKKRLWILLYIKNPIKLNDTEKISMDMRKMMRIG